MYTQGEYFTTLDFTTVNKPLWKQVFNKPEHHAIRKEVGVTYAGYSSNRVDENLISVVFKYDTKDKMGAHGDKIKSLIEENREKWSALGDLDSINFSHWKILCERANDMRFDSLLNKTDDVFWMARHTVGDKDHWVKALRAQQDAGANFDVRWWALMESVDNENEVSCVYRIARDRLQDFVLSFVESMSMMKQMATLDMNDLQVRFLNVEWETMYSMPESLKKMQNPNSDEEEIRSLIKHITTWSDNTPSGRADMLDECIFIRPTGNPLNMNQWDAMMNNSDVTNGESRLLDIHKVSVDNNMAYACYTTHSKFNYKGTDNNDVAVFTGVFVKRDGVWKMIHGQRSTGRSPLEDGPNFE